MSDAWTATTIGEIAAISFSSVDKHILAGERQICLCNYMDVYRNRRITRSIEFAPGSATSNEIARFQLQIGDVLVTKDSETPDDIGLPAVVTDDIPDTICGYHLALIRPKEGINPRFIGYHFLSDVAKRHFLQTATGVTRFGLGTRALNSLPISLPSIEEQASIIRVLEAVDMATDRVRKAINGLKDLRRTVIQDFFYAALGVTAYADRPKRELPAGWSLLTTESLLVADPKNGVSPKASTQPPGIPTFSIAAIRDGRLDLSTDANLKYTELPAKVAEKFSLNIGDVLIVRGNANPDLVGKACMVKDFPEGCIYPDITKRVVFRTEGENTVTPEYAVLAWNNPVVHNQILRRAKTSNGTLKINNRDVKQIIMPVPPSGMQKILVDLVAAAEAKTDALICKFKALEQLKRSLMHDLLTGTVRVDPALFKETSPL